LGDSANPNISTKNVTNRWNDINGDRRWQPGEEGVELSRSLEGGLALDPDIQSPYTHEASVWLERQLADTLGVRAGFVYKTEDDLTDTIQPGRPFDAFTVPFTTVDRGADGLLGTGDDSTLTFLGIPTATAGSSDGFVTNVDQYLRAKTFEVSMSKRYSNRWSASIGGAHTWITDFPNAYRLSPNNPGAEDVTTWNLKLTGSYDAAYGIRISPVLRHQSGSNYARTISIPSSTGLITSNGSTTAYVEPMNANREDNIWVFDVRADKTVSFTNRLRARMFFDLFNITNSHSSETISRATGTGYQRPSAILAPRTARVGFRFLW
jgi:hypothetical protein